MKLVERNLFRVPVHINVFVCEHARVARNDGFGAELLGREIGRCQAMLCRGASEEGPCVYGGSARRRTSARGVGETVGDEGYAIVGEHAKEDGLEFFVCVGRGDVGVDFTRVQDRNAESCAEGAVGNDGSPEGSRRRLRGLGEDVLDKVCDRPVVVSGLWEGLLKLGGVARDGVRESGESGLFVPKGAGVVESLPHLEVGPADAREGVEAVGGVLDDGSDLLFDGVDDELADVVDEGLIHNIGDNVEALTDRREFGVARELRVGGDGCDMKVGHIELQQRKGRVSVSVWGSSPEHK